MYTDDEAAALYNVLNSWGPSDDFYLAHVMSRSDVLDVGCGTGTMLHRPVEKDTPVAWSESIRTKPRSDSRKSVAISNG